MKGLSAITLAVVVAMSSTAFAAKAKTKKTKASAVTSGATLASPANSLGMPKASKVSAATEGTTTGSVKQAIPSKWTTNIYADNYVGVEDANKGAGAMSAAAFVGANYQINDKMKAYVRQHFGAKFAIDAAKDNTYSFNDTELGLGLGKIAEFANGKGGVALTNRLYLPTGEASRRAGQIAVIREVIKTSYQLTKKIEVGHVLDPRLHLQSRQSHTAADGTEAENAIVKLPQYATLGAKLDDTFSTGVAFGTVDAVTLRGTRKSNSYLDIAGSAQLTKALALTMGIDNTANIGAGQKQRHAFFRPSETAYYMNLFASM